MKQKISRMDSLYKWGMDTLAEAGIDEARLDAWYLLEAVTGISRARFLASPGSELKEEQVSLYETYINLRSTRIPLQHITHEQWFFGFPFYVNEHVLVPRRDTECLVEEALSYLKDGMHVLDMCTGSGCILISLLKMKPEISGVGVDLSSEALEVAKKNVKDLDVAATLVQSDLFESMPNQKFDMIVSNPPYIATKEIEKLEEEVKLHDPMMALDGMEDGLFFYRKIVGQSRDYLNDQGMLLFEIGYDQGEAVKLLMEEAGFFDVHVKKDLAGLDRVVIGRYN